MKSPTVYDLSSNSSLRDRVPGGKGRGGGGGG